MAAPLPKGFVRGIPRALTAQFVLCRLLDLYGPWAPDGCILKPTLRGVPLAIVERFGAGGATKRVADGHGGGKAEGRGAAQRAGSGKNWESEGCWGGLSCRGWRSGFVGGGWSWWCCCRRTCWVAQRRHGEERQYRGIESRRIKAEQAGPTATAECSAAVALSLRRFRRDLLNRPSFLAVLVLGARQLDSREQSIWGERSSGSPHEHDHDHDHDHDRTAPQARSRPLRSLHGLRREPGTNGDARCPAQLAIALAGSRGSGCGARRRASQTAAASAHGRQAPCHDTVPVSRRVSRRRKHGGNWTCVLSNERSSSSHVPALPSMAGQTLKP